MSGMLKEILGEGLKKEFMFLCKDVDKYDYVGSYSNRDCVTVAGVRLVPSSVVEKNYGKNVLEMLKHEYAYSVLFN